MNDLHERCDSVVTDLTLRKLQALLDSEFDNVLLERELMLPNREEKMINSKNLMKAQEAEHRMGLLIARTDEKDMKLSFDRADTHNKFGEGRIINQIEANSQAMLDAVSGYSNKILDRRKEVFSQFDNQEIVGDLVEVHFNTLMEYYQLCQKKLNLKNNAQEEKYLEHELEGLHKQLHEMRKTLHTHQSNPDLPAMRKSASTAVSDLCESFADRSLELNYANSTKAQDYEFAFQDKYDAALQWRYKEIEAMEGSLMGKVDDYESRYLTLLEHLHEELAQIKRGSTKAELELRRLKSLASIPPYALRNALRIRPQEAGNDILQSGIASDRDFSNNADDMYGINAGSRLADLAACSRMPAEMLQKDMMQVLKDTVLRDRGGSEVEDPSMRACVRRMAVLTTEKARCKKLANARAIPDAPMPGKALMEASINGSSSKGGKGGTTSPLSKGFIKRGNSRGIQVKKKVAPIRF